MEEQFIPYNEALSLKELNFNMPCFGYFNLTWDKPNQLLFPQYAGELENWNNSVHLCSAPLYQQAFQFFREKYKLLGIVGYIDDNSGKFMAVIDKISEDIDYSMNSLDIYKEAQLECLRKLIEICKKN